MRVTTVVSLLATTLAATVAAGELQITTTHAVPAAECKRKTQKGDNLSMHYRGRLEDGSEFDASYGRGAPFEFQIGAGRVIQGWEKGLLDMCVGEKRQLVIPYEMAYGENGMGPIPAKATLYFDTELVGIKGYDPTKDEL